jgi:hypothetical protein
MPNRIDPAMHSMERIRLRTFRDAPPGDTLASQLVERNYSALGRRLVRNPPL